MELQHYLITKGEYSDYGVVCILIGERGADFKALYAEFMAYFESVSPVFSEPRPLGAYPFSSDVANRLWHDRLWEHAQMRYAVMNERGYKGDSEMSVFISWLIKDKTFSAVKFQEFNLSDVG